MNDTRKTKTKSSLKQLANKKVRKTQANIEENKRNSDKEVEAKNDTKRGKSAASKTRFSDSEKSDGSHTLSRKERKAEKFRLDTYLPRLANATSEGSSADESDFSQSSKRSKTKSKKSGDTNEFTIKRIDSGRVSKRRDRDKLPDIFKREQTLQQVEDSKPIQHTPKQKSHREAQSNSESSEKSDSEQKKKKGILENGKMATKRESSNSETDSNRHRKAKVRNGSESTAKSDYEQQSASEMSKKKKGKPDNDKENGKETSSNPVSQRSKSVKSAKAKAHSGVESTGKSDAESNEKKARKKIGKSDNDRKTGNEVSSHSDTGGNKQRKTKDQSSSESTGKSDSEMKRSDRKKTKKKIESDHKDAKEKSSGSETNGSSGRQRTTKKKRKRATNLLPGSSSESSLDTTQEEILAQEKGKRKSKSRKGKKQSGESSTESEVQGRPKQNAAELSKIEEPTGRKAEDKKKGKSGNTSSKNGGTSSADEGGDNGKGEDKKSQSRDLAENSDHNTTNALDTTANALAGSDDCTQGLSGKRKVKGKQGSDSDSSAKSSIKPKYKDKMVVGTYDSSRADESHTESDHHNGNVSDGTTKKKKQDKHPREEPGNVTSRSSIRANDDDIDSVAAANKPPGEMPEQAPAGKIASTDDATKEERYEVPPGDEKENTEKQNEKDLRNKQAAQESKNNSPNTSKNRSPTAPPDSDPDNTKPSRISVADSSSDIEKFRRSASKTPSASASQSSDEFNRIQSERRNSALEVMIKNKYPRIESPTGKMSVEKRVDRMKLLATLERTDRKEQMYKASLSKEVKKIQLLRNKVSTIIEEAKERNEEEQRSLAALVNMIIAETKRLKNIKKQVEIKYPELPVFPLADVLACPSDEYVDLMA